MDEIQTCVLFPRWCCKSINLRSAPLKFSVPNDKSHRIMTFCLQYCDMAVWVLMYRSMADCIIWHVMGWDHSTGLTTEPGSRCLYTRRDHLNTSHTDLTSAQSGRSNTVYKQPSSTCWSALRTLLLPNHRPLHHPHHWAHWQPRWAGLCSLSVC